MRLLWVTRASKADGSTIYDSKMRNALAEGYEIIPLVAPAVHSKWAELLVMARSLVPHDRARYVSADTLRRVRRAERDVDAVILSHESVDWIAPHLTKPVVLLLHNLTSSYASDMIPMPGVSRLLTGAYQLYERRTYSRRPGLAITAISVGDRQSLEALTDAPVTLAQPGMPPVTRLAEGAIVGDSILISGTYDWRLKKRGLLQFAQEYSTHRLRLGPMFDEAPPADATAMLPDWRPVARDATRTLDFGLITDRFEAGFKLKVGSYIAENMAVLSYADIAPDYEDLPHAGEFIRRVSSVDDINAVIAQMLAAPPAGLLARFGRFQTAAAERFSWTRAGHGLNEAIRLAVN